MKYLTYIIGILLFVGTGVYTISTNLIKETSKEMMLIMLVFIYLVMLGLYVYENSYKKLTIQSFYLNSGALLFVSSAMTYFLNNVLLITQEINVKKLDKALDFDWGVMQLSEFQITVIVTVLIFIVGNALVYQLLMNKTDEVENWKK